MNHLNYLYYLTYLTHLTHILTILLLIPFGGMAQTNDSTLLKSVPYCAEAHQFQASGVIAPATLITLGSVGTFNPWLSEQRMALNDALQADGHKKLHFDDYIQYAPAVSVYALKLCGVESRHNYRDITCLMAGSYISTLILTQVPKFAFNIERPNGGSHSFPSGHTATAFTGAELLRREYGKEYPYIAVAGYAVATTVAVMRVYNNAHWATDVLAGAGVGILSTSLAYWLAPYLTIKPTKKPVISD